MRFQWFPGFRRGGLRLAGRRCGTAELGERHSINGFSKVDLGGRSGFGSLGNPGVDRFGASNLGGRDFERVF